MFAAVYAFTVHPDQHGAFVESWRELTKLIRDYEGGLGSRLHRASEDSYIAYAQWPDRATWEASGDKLPQPAGDRCRSRMRAACREVETVYQMEMVADLLVPAH